MKKRKILLVDDLVDGGAKRVVYEQLRGLRHEYDVGYATTQISQVFPPPSNVQVHRIDTQYRTHSGILRPITEMSLLRHVRYFGQEVRRLIHTHDYELVMSHPSVHTQSIVLGSLPVPQIYFGEEWYRLWYEQDAFPLPTRLSRRVYEWGRRWAIASIDRWNTRYVDRCLVTSQYVAKQFDVAYKITAEVVRLGVDTKLFEPNSEALQSYFLVFVESKNPLWLSALLRTPLPFRIKQVVYDPDSFMTDGKLVSVYQNAVATLCMTKNEPFGLTPLESMSCGVPVIAHRSGGHLETVVDGQTGYLVPNRLEVLVERMKRLSNKSHRAEMSKQARDHVLAHFTWDRHIHQLSAVIREL